VLYVPTGLTDLRLCGQADGIARATTNTTLTATVGCSLVADRPGLVFAVADAWLGLLNPSALPYEAKAQIWLNGSAPGSTGLRYTDVATDTADGQDVGLAASSVFTVAAGTHHLSLNYSLFSGVSHVAMNDASLAALYVPLDSPFARACADTGSALWTNTTQTFSALADCALTAPADGWMFASATASTGLTASPNNQPNEALFGLGYDTLSINAASARFVNSYPNQHDGTDGGVAASQLRAVPAGEHHIYFAGRRWNSAAATVVGRHAVLFVLVPGAPIFLPAVLR
jgi:hypothetical protein